MSLTNKYFKTISPELLLKWGCPPFEFIKMMWKRVIPEPVCEWGSPVSLSGGTLIVVVEAREYIAAFRAEADTIIRTLNQYPLRLSSLQVKLKHE
ncbi:MAG: hypothetical protein DRJ08_07635 [Acidobacteria bacterium]|nr:MAG: hypothetical protein DRJ08_07635 [Acidobacteriota bacterium]